MVCFPDLSQVLHSKIVIDEFYSPRQPLTRHRSNLIFLSSQFSLTFFFSIALTIWFDPGSTTRLACTMCWARLSFIRWNVLYSLFSCFFFLSPIFNFTWLVFLVFLRNWLKSVRNVERVLPFEATWRKFNFCPNIFTLYYMGATPDDPHVWPFAHPSMRDLLHPHQSIHRQHFFQYCLSIPRHFNLSLQAIVETSMKGAIRAKIIGICELKGDAE